MSSTKEASRSAHTAAAVSDHDGASSSSASSASSRTTVEADLKLPADCFLLPKQNEGFQIPYFLSSAEEVDKIRPPAVVKTWEQRHAELDETQQRRLADFRKMVADAPWYDEAKFDGWLCLRYLIARSYDLKKAFAMLENTVKWWKETGSETWHCETCLENSSNHMGQFIGWDLEYRPVMFMSMRWGQDRSNPLHHMVTAFNHMIRQMPVGVEKWVCVTDFETYSHLRDGKPSMGLTVIRAIQDHFPERLGKMVCINPPKLFSVLWKLLLPAIDPVTRSKVEFLWTEASPAVCEAFPRLFPPHLSAYLCDSYDRSKHDLPATPLVWRPRPEGYPTTYAEREQQLKAMKEKEKMDKKDAKKAAHETKHQEKEERRRERHERKQQQKKHH
ncbi:CRAL/TRIO, N-terminal domain/CRAL/TRIO domain containing protein [Novymonas esmeraldas]|uniref:CRAL/TRIO, N-terminal domain/CRAL/TRIO domain containing protein n=1 Tax=Novymonas esmeraldas TaxID=1808958 RepID=A0AAW0F5E0_9TRYP